jgi:aspartate/methionine/tyrosine aminotransferase
MLNEGNHQYVRAFGSLNYLKSIKNFHGETFNDLDIEKHIVTTFGGSEALYCCIMGLVNEGQEVIIFDPAYDVYRPQVQMAGGKTIGIQLRPKKRVDF